MLKVDNLEFSFKDFQVLSGISFEAGRGSIVSILGNNGAGKSTLLRCIARLLSFRKWSYFYRWQGRK